MLTQKSDTMHSNPENKLARRSFLVKTALVVGGAALSLTAGGIAFKVTHAAGNSSQATAFYRLNNGKDHFYTADPQERDNAIKHFGYKLEGIACYVAATHINGSTAFYRLNNGTDHFYTADPKERDNAIAYFGYKLEGIACYVAATHVSGTTAFYRLNNGTDHFYTIDPQERDNAIKHFGYKLEGVACYVLPR